MAFWNRGSGGARIMGPAEGISDPSTTRISSTVRELIDKYDLVDVQDGYVIVSNERQSVKLGEVSELGSSNSRYGSFAREEYNPALRGKLGLAKYDEMRRSDAQVRMSLLLKKIPVLSARWYLEPASKSKQDLLIADHVWNNLTKWITTPWEQVLTEALLMVDFGVYSFEKVFVVTDGLVRWQKLAPRHPMDLHEWKWDANGGPDGGVFYAEIGDNSDPGAYYGPGGRTRVNTSISDGVFIPISKLIVFSHDREADNLSGISALRSAYKHWYFKDIMYKIDAIQKERHSVGIPVIKLPPGFSEADRKKADELGRNLRANERAHIVLPPMWEIMMLKMEGQTVNVLDSIEHHDMMIARNVLAGFMNEDNVSDTAKAELFTRGTRYLADIVKGTFNKWCIEQLVTLNWGSDVEPPELRYRRIGETIDWRTISFALRNLVGAGLILPDDELREHLREEIDLPKEDKATAYDLPTPQLPGSASMPRQSKATNQKIEPPNNNRTQDRSGG